MYIHEEYTVMNKVAEMQSCSSNIKDIHNTTKKLQGPTLKDLSYLCENSVKE